MSFQKLKVLLTAASILTLLVEGKGFTRYYDTFGVGLGCVMIQRGRVIDYALRQLKLFEPVTVVFVLMI